MRIYFWAFALSLAFFLSPGARASDCSELYALTEVELAAVRPEFLAEHTRHYTYEAPLTPVKDQCNYGGCWSYGSVASLESRLLRARGKEVALSEQYLLLLSLQERAALALETPGGRVSIGGNFLLAERLVDERGIVPASVWKPRIPFEKNPHSGRFTTFLNNRIAKFHLDAAHHPEKREALLAKAKKDIDALLFTYSGPMPTSFTFEGVTYASPKEFAEKFLPIENRLTTRIFPKEQDLPESLEKARTFGSGSNAALNPVNEVKVFNKSQEELEAAVVTSLKRGKSVSVSVEMTNEFIDPKTGIMSTKAFHTPEGFEPVPAKYRNAFNIGGGGHLMEIVGVDLDADGKIVKFKIKNSWGDKSGDEGFYHMYPDYFRHYVQYVDIP